MHTESVAFSGAFSGAAGQTRCRFAELDAVCIKRLEGPLIVTDLAVIQGCPERIFVGATESDSAEFGFNWLLEATAEPMTGARLLVRGGEWLQVAFVADKKGFSQSPQCMLTWSGFKPRLVPQN